MNCGAQLKKETESRTTDCVATAISGGEEKPFIILEVLLGEKGDDKKHQSQNAIFL